LYHRVKCPVFEVPYVQSFLARNRELAQIIRRLYSMRRFCVCLVWAVAASAQPPEAGRLERNGNQATLIVESPRPLDSAAIKIAEQFGIPVSAEDPPYLYQDDMKDVTAEVGRRANHHRRIFVPKGGRLEVQFTIHADGSPVDIQAFLQDLVDKANARFPFGYRLDGDGEAPVLVPTRTRDLQGRVVEITPLLDRRVTIPPGSRTIAESAKLMAEALSVQTGLRVSCCQGVVAGFPWGMAEVAFEARDEPARSVLKRLIAASLEGRPNGYYWLQRCDPLPSNWCFINLGHIPARTGPFGAQTGLPLRPNQPPNSDGSPRWFDSNVPAGPPQP
jgi:hypothetical protein